MNAEQMEAQLLDENAEVVDDEEVIEEFTEVEEVTE